MNAAARQALTDVADRLEAALLDHLAQRDKFRVFEELASARSAIGAAGMPGRFSPLSDRAAEAGLTHNAPLGRHCAAELVLRLREDVK